MRLPDNFLIQCVQCNVKHRLRLHVWRRDRSAEFCDQLAKRLSGEFGRNSMQDVQVKRRDSFLDISIPMDDSKSAASLESLMFFSKTISDTANTFQQSLNDTAEKFSRTLDETAAKLKNAISEKNLDNASTQEISETLHETADLLTKTSEMLSNTAKVVKLKYVSFLYTFAVLESISDVLVNKSAVS